MTRGDRRPDGGAREGRVRDPRDLARDPLGAGAGLVWVGWLAAVGTVAGGIAALLDAVPRLARPERPDRVAPREP